MNKEFYTTKELEGLPGIPTTQQGIRLKAENDNPKWKKQKRAKGKGWEYHIDSLPPETRVALLIKYKSALDTALDQVKEKHVLSKTPKKVSYDRDSLWRYFESKSQKQKDKATAKHKVFQMMLIIMEREAKSPEQALSDACDAYDVVFSTFKNIWHGKNGKIGLKRYDQSDWLPALVDGYTGKRETAEFSTEAWDLLKADYLRLEAPTLAMCYRNVLGAAEEHGWTVPSYEVVLKRINNLPITIRTLKRKGEHALMRLYPALKRTVKELHALEWINGDGYMHNVFVKMPDGRVIRLKTWFWQDIYSRKIIGWRTDETEHTDLIRLSFGDIVEKFGIPKHVTIDNTRAAANKWMTGGVPNRYRFKIKEDDPMGLFPMLGVDVHWTGVNVAENGKGKGHGQAKPIERAFGVGGLGDYVDKHIKFTGAYTGANPNAKPENYGMSAVPYDEFIKVLNQQINMWNAIPKRRTEICAGKLSFDQAFEQSYSTSTIKKATPEQRRLWLMSAEAIKVQSDGTFTLESGSSVGVGRNRYRSDELLEYRNHKIVVRFDPDNLHGKVYAYTLDGRFIGDAVCMLDTGFGDKHSAREHTRARKQFIRATKDIAAAEQRMDAIEAARLMPDSPEPETPKAGAVEVQFGKKPLKVANGADLHQEDSHESNFISLMSELQKQKRGEV